MTLYVSVLYGLMVLGLGASMLNPIDERPKEPNEVRMRRMIVFGLYTIPMGRILGWW